MSDSSVAFCEAAKDSSSNLTSGLDFDSNLVYLLRFLVTGWQSDPPACAAVLPLAKAIAGSLACAGDLSLYSIKSILFGRVPPGSKAYYSESFAFGFEGCQNVVTADEGTWYIDLIFQPKNDELIMWTHPKIWAAIVRAALASLAGKAGTPEVHVSGLFEMILYAATRGLWDGVQPYWEIKKRAPTPEEQKLNPDLKYSFDVNAINRSSPYVAWAQYPPYLGHNAVGFAIGDAFFPNELIRLGECGTISPPSGTPPATQPAPDPATPDGANTQLPAANVQTEPITWASLTTGQKAAAMVLGAGLTVALCRSILRL